MKLSPDQIEDAQLMASKQDLPNFSKAGTGKTHTALEAMKLTGAKRNVVLAPKIALDWWREAAEEHLGVDVTVIRAGANPLVGDFIVTTYDLARNIIPKLIEWSNGGNLTLDESHYVCNPESKRTKVIFGKHTNLVGSLAEWYDQVWCMTGTPKLNYSNDLWTQAGVLHPEVFDRYGITSYDDFCNKFTFRRQKQFHPNMRPVWKISGDQNEFILNKIIYQEIGAIRRKEAPGLPSLRMRELHVNAKLEKDLVRRLRTMTPDEILYAIKSDDEVMSKAWKLVGLAKIPEVVPYLGDSVKDSPVLLGCWHHDVMNAYAEECDSMGLSYMIVHGGTPETKRKQARDLFNKGELDVLIGQMKAMGVSWNLQEMSSHVIVAETHPSPSVIEQFYKRVYRRGQKSACQVDIIMSDTPIDDAMNRVRLRKEDSDDKIHRQ